LTHSSNRLKVGRSLVLKVVGIGDLAWSPWSLVIWVVNVRSSPFALVVGVFLVWSLPRTASRSLFTLGVGDLGRNPVTILLIIPILWLLSFWVRNCESFVLKPVIRFLSFLVWELIWLILIPIFWFSGRWVWNTGKLNPIFGLGVLGIINLLVWVFSRAEVLEKAAILGGLIIDHDFKGIVRLHNEGVKGGELIDLGLGRSLEMLLLVFASLGILVLEDEVNLFMSVLRARGEVTVKYTLLVAPHLSGLNIIT